MDFFDYVSASDKPQRPEYSLTGPKPTKLEPNKGKIDQMLEEAPYSAVRILKKLQAEGVDRKYSIVKTYLRGKKTDLDEKATVRFEAMPGKQGQMDRGSSRITWCTRTGNGRSCTVFS